MAESQLQTGLGITAASFPIADFRKLVFLRVTIREERGGRAATNPIWFEG